MSKFFTRAIPVLGALGGGILVALAIQIDLDTFANIYSKDFRAVSELSSATRGTCVWHPPTDEVNAHLGGYWLHDDRAKCGSHTDRYREMAAFSVHGMRWMLQNHTDRVATLNMQHLQIAYEVAKYAVIGRTMHIRYDDVSLALEAVEFPPVSCDAIYAGVTSAAGTWDSITLPEPICDDTTPITPSNQDTSPIAHEDAYLRYLCEKQFSYGRSKHSSNALRLPDFRSGFKPDPNIFEGLMNYNESTSWAMKVDTYVGLRYGSFMFYVVPHTVLNALLGVDAVLLVLWESTMKARYSAIASMAATNDASRLNMLDQLLTAKIMRKYRGSLCALLWVIAAALYGALVVLPYGAEGEKFPRPECTSSGWRSDEPNVMNTYMALVFSLGAIIAHPLASTFNGFCKFGKRATIESRTRGADLALPARPKTGFKRTFTVLGGVTIGFLVFLADSVTMQIAFSSEWTKSVTLAAGSTHWNSLKIQNQIYNLGSSVIIVAVSTGATSALVLGRWLFGGKHCLMVLFFSIWVVSLGATLVPIFVTSSNEYIFDNLIRAIEGNDLELTKGSDMCEGLNGAIYTYCKDARPFVVVGSALVTFLAVFIMAVYWCCRLTNSRACFKFGNGRTKNARTTQEMEDAIMSACGSTASLLEKDGHCLSYTDTTPLLKEHTLLKNASIISAPLPSLQACSL